MGIRLKGHTAIITGGSRGQGAAEARRFAEEGAFVIIADLLDREGEELVAEIGSSAIYKHLDVTNQQAWLELIEDVLALRGSIDVLVNNAGILVFDRLTRTSQEEFERVMDVNCTGVFLGMQAVSDAMKNQNSGSIVNISSVAGLQGVGFQFSYSVSKWAVRGMTKSAAHELARHNIRVNSVHPGLINTAMLDQFEDEGFNSAAVQVPMGRTASAEEVAELVLWLASNESSYCTGSEFVVDGGISAT
jgi:3alpha(or 20beta)-hydroxysteroid dehydrogenase|tara:strand:+ start:390 stop:1130 length:741 start_codon:yes stop_codon:yes gene_type:complete